MVRSHPRDARRPAVYDKVAATLRQGCLAAQRPLSVKEIVEIAGDEVLEELRRAYPSRSPQDAMRYVLDRLNVLGDIKSGRLRGRPWYSVPSLVAAQHPGSKSRRKRTLDLIVAAVNHYHRAVRLVDLRKFAVGKTEYEEVVARLSHGVGSLRAFGEVQVVHACRGGGVDGSNYYLPAGYNVAAYPPELVPTWMEQVQASFRRAWSEEVARAQESATRPRPILVSRVRELLLADDPDSKAADAQLVINAVAALATGEPPVLREVSTTGERYHRLWAPVDVPDSALDLGSVYASDSERLVEAVRRACASSGEPVADVGSIRRQIEADPLLHLTGSQRVHAALTKLALRSSVAAEETARVRQSIARIGRVKGRTYYTAPTPRIESAGTMSIEAARAYVADLQAELALAELGVDAEISAAALARLPSARTGRLLYLAQQLRSIRAGLDDSEVSQERAGRVAEQVDQHLQSLSEMKEFHAGKGTGLPSVVNAPSLGWTGEEMVPMFRHVYGANPRMADPVELNRNLWSRCRRFPNPNFSVRTESAEFLYDATSVLLQIAGQSRGREALLLAGMAEGELGPLRDERFVISGLQDASASVRHAAVAALAFLPGAGAASRLRTVALSDPDAAVRRSAVWAYASYGVEDVGDLLKTIVEQDPDPRLRTFADMVLAAPEPVNWWVF